MARLLAVLALAGAACVSAFVPMLPRSTGLQHRQGECLSCQARRRATQRRRDRKSLKRKIKRGHKYFQALDGRAGRGGALVWRCGLCNQQKALPSSGLG